MNKGFIFAIIILVLISIPTAFGILGDFWWFEALGFGSVFTTILSTQVLLWAGFFVLSAIVFIVNIKFSLKEKKKIYLFILVGLFFSVVLASVFTNWQVFLKFDNASSFGITDPVFGNDIGFYTFVLPFFKHLLLFGLSLTLLSLVLSSGSYLSKFMESVKSRAGFLYTNEKGSEESLSINWAAFWKKSSAHLTILIFVFLILAAVGMWFLRYDLLFSFNGAVFGASFVDVNVWLPVLTILSLLTLVSGIVFLFNKFIGLKKALIPVGLVLLVAILGSIYAGAIQSLQVEPNEFNLERSFIERNINHTLNAYGLNDVSLQEFVPGSITLNEARESKSVKNVRLWDWRPLETTYEQIQLFRTYYDFNDVDTDRYENTQYVLSARELNFKDLSTEAQTWVNKHLVYTHGYGLVMSPVSKIGGDGLPILSVKDIPPESDNFTILRPQIYYGELTNDFVITDTTTREFDYPMGNENKYTIYNGTGGLKLDGMKRLVYSFTEGSVQLLLSSSVNEESKILLNRDIKKRLGKIAPFLAYDEDPYLVTENGKLYWIIDAYTKANKYPYSRPMGNVNYIKNSVKVVLDAYNGNVDFYVIEDEPVINTYKKIFPDLFKDFDKMPEYLKKHIRYPEGLFNIQSKIYSLYHMKDPQVFYNKEDEWKIPNEIFRGTQREMEAYYIILETENETQFSLITPFTPVGKDNMIAWMAGFSDGDRYGDLIIYKFSKQELEYGPIQIENRIDQNTEISQLFSLWDQQGSNVIRGNLLVIPVKDSILYVEPVYLQASSGGIPQLKRVIVAYKDNLAMETDLEKALEAVFKGEPINDTDETDGTELPKDLIKRANEIYENAQDALKNGDFSEYADYIEDLGEVLRELNE